MITALLTTTLLGSGVNRSGVGSNVTFTATVSDAGPSSTATPGAQYHVVASGSLKTYMASWTPVVGSTDTAPTPPGAWSCVVSNPAPACYRGGRG